MNAFLCKYCGQFKPWKDRDYEYGAFLSEIGHPDGLERGEVPLTLICQTCAEESKREGYEV